LRDVTNFVQYVNLALYTVAAVVAFRQWLQHRERAALWAALTFTSLAIVVDAGRLLPEDPAVFWERVLQRFEIALLVLFPYLLYRFAVSFRPPSRPVALFVGSLTVAMVVSTFLLPMIPGPDERWPASFAVYIAAFAVHWTVLSIVVAWTLWTAGRGEAGVPRRRMRLLAFAATAITVALLLAIVAPDSDSAAALISQLFSTASAIAFVVGLAPPAILRTQWRRPETARTQEAIAGLMSATTPRDVVDRVLGPIAAIVGARALELRDATGDVLGRHGSFDVGEERVAELDAPGGSIRMVTSPYAPFFGRDELNVLRTMVVLTALALDRARLFENERAARVALERADEVKTNFVALAAHELRTPVATVHGLVETLLVRRVELEEQQIRELEQVLQSQTRRMKSLVEQLLDLSRLDADAVAIRPQRLVIRNRVEEIVDATAPDRAAEIRLDVDPGLEADIDPAAFDRIVSNLVVNALRYGATPVTVSATQTDRHFRLSVEDCGDGVAPEFVPDLFERFTRSNASRSRAGGTGLGLAIARSYAHAHRGDLIYEAAEPTGARFQLVLPVAS